MAVVFVILAATLALVCLLLLGGELQGRRALYQTAIVALTCALLGAVGLFVALFRIIRKQTSGPQLDPLTRLLSADGLKAAGEQAVASGNIDQYAFVAMDIMSFRQFNAMFGGIAGDTLLETIGQVIAAEYAFGTRLSADVFAFLAKDRPSVSGKIAQKLQKAIEEAMGPEQAQIARFSFGVYPLRKGIPFQEAFDGAMMALRQAKGQTSHRDVVVDLTMQDSFAMRGYVEANMIKGLQAGEFEVYVQPQFSAQAETFTSGEALVRWKSANMGDLMPDAFVPLFESNHFVSELDFYVLERVLAALRRTLDKGLHPRPIAVNQSRNTMMASHYLQKLEDILKIYDVPAEYVCLEITESVMEHEGEDAKAIIHALKKIGFIIALDDFGTGFSSLNTLRDLPVDVLKIDKAFVEDLGNSERNQAIIRNIISMSKELSTRVVCEGVETPEQARFLKENGCDTIQGYYYAKPMPLAEYEEVYMVIEGR